MAKRYDIVATVFDKRGRVLGVGKNSYERTHPRQSKLAERVGLPHKIYLHSEISALIKALKRGIPHKIKIERYDASGRPKLAKPCPICDLAIKEAGVKFIEYTIG